MTLERSKIVARFLAKEDNTPDFETVTDPRDRRGRRWSLPSVLRGLYFGMVALCRSMLEVEQMTEALGPCRQFMGVERRLPDSTAGDILEVCKPQEFAPLLTQQVRHLYRSKSFGEPMLPISLLSIGNYSGGIPRRDAS